MHCPIAGRRLGTLADGVAPRGAFAGELAGACDARDRGGSGRVRISRPSARRPRPDPGRRPSGQATPTGRAMHFGQQCSTPPFGPPGTLVARFLAVADGGRASMRGAERDRPPCVSPRGRIAAHTRAKVNLLEASYHMQSDALAWLSTHVRECSVALLRDAGALRSHPVVESGVEFVAPTGWIRQGAGERAAAQHRYCLAGGTFGVPALWELQGGPAAGSEEEARAPKVVSPEVRPWPASQRPHSGPLSVLPAMAVSVITWFRGSQTSFAAC